MNCFGEPRGDARRGRFFARNGVPPLRAIMPVPHGEVIGQAARRAQALGGTLDSNTPADLRVHC